MLTTADLTTMRSVAVQALPDSCVIQTQAWVSDSGGGGSTAWTTAGTLSCRLSPLVGSMEREHGDRISADADFLVTLPFDASVTTDSRFSIGGAIYNVEAIRNRSWRLTTRVETVKET